MDSSGAGTDITCPSCGEKIVIPQAPAAPRPSPPAGEGVHPVNPIASSAAAKIEMHLKVPVHNKPSESLIVKPLVPLEAAAAKETDKKIRIKTIRHTDCIEVGHDRFDEMVSAFLSKVGESNVISINSINYTILDIASQKLMTDYGLQVVYRG